MLASAIVFLLLASTIIAFSVRSSKIEEGYLGSCGVVLQSKWNNCGPAALKMIFDHYHIPSSVEEIEQSVGLTDEGSSMLALKRIALTKGLKTEGWKLSFRDFATRPFPLLVYIRNDHFVVVDSVVADAIFIRDPAVGKLKLSQSKFLNIWNGETLVFSNK